jgi:K+-sensing histidine kinase KdpD
MPRETPRALNLAARYLLGTLVVGIATCTAWLSFGHSHQPDVVMTFLLGVVLASMRLGYGPSLFVAMGSVAAYDYYFVEPYFRLTVTDPWDLITLVIMLFVALVISSLTDRVRKEAAVAQRAKVQVETEQLRNSLLSSVSHDLRTPLAVVQGAATALLDDWDDLPAARRREFLETISDETLRLNRIVRNLLDMTALDANALRVKKELQPIEEVIGVALGRLEELLRDHPIETDVPHDLPLVALDATLIDQVLVNLVENAAKYSPVGSSIQVSAHRAAGGVEVAVADRGPGLTPGDEEQIFEKFYRANRTQPGMGLGLTICRGIVRAHGGTIRAEARPGGGALVRFTLPADQHAGKGPVGMPEEADAG